jgi:hypothetical protein
MTWLPQRRLRRWLLIAGIALFTLLAALSVWSLYARSSFARRIAVIRAAGDPAVIADLAPKPIPYDDNAAAQLMDAAPRGADFSKEYGAFFNTPVGQAYDAAKDAGQPATIEQLAAIRAIVDKYADLDAAITKAAACERYASPLDFSLPHPQFLNALMNHPIQIRTIARFLVWKMELALADGRPDEAIRHGIRILRLASLYQAEPSIVASQITMAVYGSATDRIYDALTARPVSPAVQAELDDELARFNYEKLAVHALKTERAVSVSGVEAQLSVAHPIVVNTVGWPMKQTYVSALEYFDVVLPIADQPWHSSDKQAFKTPTGYGVMADMMASQLEAQHEATNRLTASLRALRIFSALRLYAEEHGREANGMEDLQLPKAATVDPFSGKPLKLKLTQDGWIVYSVFKNQRDDGGDFRQMKDWGVAPASARQP